MTEASSHTRKVWLHIGLGKCGTSSLQRILAIHANALSKGGYLYPALESLDAAVKGHVTSGNAALLARSLLDHKHFFFQPGKELFLRRLKHVLTDASYRNVVLSSEFFSMLNHGQVRDLVATINSWGPSVTVICYIRRQDDMALSSYIQGLIAGHSSVACDFADEVFELSKRFAYSNLLDPWLHLEPPNEITVHVYERDRLTRRDVVTDFLAILGLDSGFERIAEQSINPSLNASSAYLLYLLRRENFPEAKMQKLLALLRSQTWTKQQPYRVLVGSEYRKKILSLHREDNRRLAAHIPGNSSALLFAEDDASFDDQEYNKIPELTDALPVIISLVHRFV